MKLSKKQLEKLPIDAICIYLFRYGTIIDDIRSDTDTVRTTLFDYDGWFISIEMECGIFISVTFSDTKPSCHVKHEELINHYRVMLAKVKNAYNPELTTDTIIKERCNDYIQHAEMELESVITGRNW